MTRIETQDRTSWRRVLRAETIAALAAMFAFCNILPNEFCYDDPAVVRDNPKINEPGRWAEVWTTDFWSADRFDVPDRDLLYRPIALSAHRLVRSVAGIAPHAHHAVNILLHALLSVLVVRLCRHVGGDERAAVVAGVLFAVLPIHCEAVAPVVGLSDLLATFGVLVCLLAHRRSLLATDSSAIVGWRSVAALAAFLAMGSKENGVAVLVLIPLFDLLWYRGVTASASSKLKCMRTFWRSSYLLIALAVYLVLRYHALEGNLYQTPPLTKTVNVLVDAPPWQRLLGAMQLWGMYWAKTVWPSVLSIKYTINSVRLATDVTDPHVLVGVTTLVLLVGVSVYAIKRRQYGAAVLALACVVSYAPTANLFVLIRVFLAERIWYLPSVWVTVFAALLIAPRLRRSITWFVFAAIAIGMVGRCWLRNAEWRNNGVLYAAAATDQPNGAGALQLFGHWLSEHGDNEQGILLLTRAADIDPGFTDSHRSLGMAHWKADNLSAALEHLRIAEMQVPHHAPTSAALTRISAELSANDADFARLERVVADDPTDFEAMVALIRKLRDLGRTREALSLLTRHDAAFADDARWHAEFAVTLVFLNERDRAINRYRQSLQIKPDAPQQTVELAMLLRERATGDDLDHAWRLAKHAYALAPKKPSVMVCRAELLALRGDLTEAIAMYRAAMSAYAPGSEQRRAFEQRARTLGWQPGKENAADSSP